MKSGKLVVKSHSPWRSRFIAGGLVLFSTVAGAGLYYLGENHAGFNQVSAAQERQRLREVISNLEQEKADLRDKVALLERSNQVDRQAYTKVDSDLKSLQEEILELREEVTFYRGIVSPAESSAGLRIERFSVAKQVEEGLYHYNLVLTQVLKNERIARGVVDVTVKGFQDGQPKDILLRELSPQRDGRRLGFRFRYFQKFEGDLRLPEGFVPRSVEVEVNPHRRKQISRTFDWPSANPTNSAASAVSG